MNTLTAYALPSIEDYHAEVAAQRVRDSEARLDAAVAELAEIQAAMDILATATQIDWNTTQALIDARDQARTAVAEERNLLDFLLCEIA